MTSPKGSSTKKDQSMKTLEEKPNYSVKEVADYLGFSPEAVRLWCRTGQIGAQRIGTAKSSHWRISKESLDDFLNVRR